MKIRQTYLTQMVNMSEASDHILSNLYTRPIGSKENAAFGNALRIGDQAPRSFRESGLLIRLHTHI